MPVVGRVEGRYNPHRVESYVKEYWDKIALYKLVFNENSKCENSFLFIDGPPYPSGDVPHVGTAWNKSLKDAVLRFKRMTGYRVFDKPGYDCHGLPIEVKVEQKLGVKYKREIEERIGVEEFINACKRLVYENVNSMTKWFMELGVLMDWDNPYLTMRGEYIESGWWLIKKADEMSLLDNEYRVVYWCPRCSTTLAEYEVEYSEVIDPSIYVKFPVKGREEEYLVIWTTTPWTLPANTFIMANPDAVYVKISVDGEKYILAKERLSDFLSKTSLSNFSIVEEFSGRELEGLEYRHPLHDLIPLQEQLSKYHKVVLSKEHVALTEGTGLVHGAPGHGFEDYEVGLEYGITAAASPVDEEGRFTTEVGAYAGMHVREANKRIISDLESRGCLLHKSMMAHRYPVCWRCKTPVVLRATKQWIIRVTKVKNELIKEAGRVKWIPSWAFDRLLHILNNLQDWVISRQRYWGIPLPIWICPNGHRVVIGSLEELLKYSGRRPKELHKPWIDEITFKCPTCSNEMRRVPDVADVWFDSGIAFYAARGKPFELRASEVSSDFIVEGHDQVRGWFFSLLRAGVIGFGVAPYKCVLVHGFALDEKGREMHKSLGNYVGTDEAIERAGRDPLRLWLLQNTVWEDLKFSWDGVNEIRSALDVAWNVFVFASTYMNLDNYDPLIYPVEGLRDYLKFEDKWLLSRVNKLIKEVTNAFNEYRLHEAVRMLKDFMVEDVSHWYVRFARPRVWIEESALEKVAAYASMYYALKKWLIAIAPLAPFLAEELYLEFVKPAEPDLPPSIHLLKWPIVDEDFIDEGLEESMNVVRELASAAASARMSAGIKLRQPVKCLTVYTNSDLVKTTLTEHLDAVLFITNSKSLEVKPLDEVSKIVRYVAEPIYSVIGSEYRSLAKEVIKYVEENAESVAKDIVTLGRHEIEISGLKIAIEPRHVNVRKTYDDNLIVREFKHGVIALDTRLTLREVSEGLAREIVRRIQVMRKDMKLPVDAKVNVWIQMPREAIDIVGELKNYIASEVRALELTLSEEPPSRVSSNTYRKEWLIGEDKVTIYISA